MTAIHVINCLMLAYLPYFIAYSTTSLKEDRLGSLIAASAGYYLLSQIVQMFLLATFTTPPEHDEFAWVHEILKVALSLLDFYAIQRVYQRKSGASRSQKCFAVGLGWAGCDTLLHSLLPLLRSSMAHTNEFGWDDLQMAIRSNIKILTAIALAASILQFDKKRGGSKTTPAMAVPLLAGNRLLPLVVNLAQYSLGVSTWNSIFLEGGLAAFMAATSFAALPVFKED